MDSVPYSRGKNWEPDLAPVRKNKNWLTLEYYTLLMKPWSCLEIPKNSK